MKHFHGSKNLPGHWENDGCYTQPLNKWGIGAAVCVEGDLAIYKVIGQDEDVNAVILREVIGDRRVVVMGGDVFASAECP